MLENKKLNMILSLLIAIALWAFVIGEVNPEATRTYRDIPIQFINEEMLYEYDLAVYSVSDTTLSVTVTGTRSEVNQVETKDIVATVDLDQAAIGENQLRVEVKVPSKVDVETQSLNKVTVSVENRISKEVPIRVRYNGSFEGEEEPITIDQNMDFIWVTGAESNIARVDHVQAIVEEGSVVEEASTFDCKLVPMDDKLNKVYNVEMEASTIEVTAELTKTKTVPLEVSIVGAESVRFERTITVPETITLKGRNVDLETITSVVTETIDVSEIKETTNLEVIPILPEGVQVSSKTEKLQASVQVVRQTSKAFNFSDNEIAVENLDDGLVAKIKTKTVKVSVHGNQDVVSGMTKESIALSADLAGLKAGQHTVTIDIACTSSSVELQCEPLNAVVVIEAVEADGENGDDVPDTNEEHQESVEDQESIPEESPDENLEEENNEENQQENIEE